MVAAPAHDAGALPAVPPTLPPPYAPSAPQHSGGIRFCDEALGPARQVLPDEHFRQHGTLGTSYKHCTSVRAGVGVGGASWAGPEPLPWCTSLPLPGWL